MMGLRWENPDPLATCRLRRDCKDLVGPVTISFNYKKTENAPTGDLPFYFFWQLFIFSRMGKTKQLRKHGKLGTGNKAWQNVSENIRRSRSEILSLDNLIGIWTDYDATIDLDRLTC